MAGQWKKIGHIIRACCCANTQPPPPTLSVCAYVQGCGTTINDGTHKPLPGATVKVSWSRPGDTTGNIQTEAAGNLTLESGGKLGKESGQSATCTTDAGGNCCVTLTGADATAYPYTVVISHPAYQSQTVVINQGNPASLGIILVPKYVIAYVHVRGCVPQDQLPAGGLPCAHVATGLQSVATDASGNAVVYLDPNLAAQDITVSAPPLYAPQTATIRWSNYPGGIPCSISSGFTLDAASGYVCYSLRSWYPPDNVQSESFSRPVKKTLYAAVGGQVVTLNYIDPSVQSPYAGQWTGCMTLHNVPTIIYPTTGCFGPHGQAPNVADCPCLVSFNGQSIGMAVNMCGAANDAGGFGDCCFWQCPILAYPFPSMDPVVALYYQCDPVKGLWLDLPPGWVTERIDAGGKDHLTGGGVAPLMYLPRDPCGAFFMSGTMNTNCGPPGSQRPDIPWPWNGPVSVME